MTDRPDTPQEALNPEEHADGFTPFWGYVVGFDKYADLSARVAELEAERDKLRLQHGNLINDTVSMGMAKDEAEARIEQQAEKIGKLATLLDKELGTPCEAIRHEQEVDALQARIAELEALLDVSDDFTVAYLVGQKDGDDRAKAAEARVAELTEALLRHLPQK